MHNLTLQYTISVYTYVCTFIDRDTTKVQFIPQKLANDTHYKYDTLMSVFISQTFANAR